MMIIINKVIIILIKFTCHCRCCTNIPNRAHPTFDPQQTPRTQQCSSPKNNLTAKLIPESLNMMNLQNHHFHHIAIQYNDVYLRKLIEEIGHHFGVVVVGLGGHSKSHQQVVMIGC